MSWTIARLGSRFNLLFEPQHRRVRHAALGRFLDRPLDLKVGLVEPDGTERVLPLTQEGEELFHCEQFERINSITFRGFSERHNLRFELNVHSPFYPQDERLCVMPAFYLEMRVTDVRRIRWHTPDQAAPKNVRLFIRLQRDETEIESLPGDENAGPRIGLSYDIPLAPENMNPARDVDDTANQQAATARERIVSVNPEAEPLATGDGLQLDLPVTRPDSGIKWRLVWAAHIAEPVLTVKQEGEDRPAALHYNQYWANVDEVVEEALQTRDDNLAYSRRFEKILEQAPIDMASRHLLNQGFQSWLANTWLVDVPTSAGEARRWFTVWEGSSLYHSTLDVEYNNALLPLAIWPGLLADQLHQWAEHLIDHPASEGAYAPHDLGSGLHVTGAHYPEPMEVEESSNFLILAQAHAHWTGERELAKTQGEAIERVARYLLWCDREGLGFPSVGAGNPIDDAITATQFSPRQTYLAVKRIAALRAAETLLTMSSRTDLAERCQQAAEEALSLIERRAWLGDHYAVCIENEEGGGSDVLVGAPMTHHTPADWDAYSIYASNGLLLPMLSGQPPLLDEQRVRSDITAGIRENFSRYGCGHTSADPSDIWLSQNMWRDHIATYLRVSTVSPQCYWDLQVVSNTHHQSMGCVDTYITNCLCHYPRGVTAMGYLLAGPRVIVNRLASGGAYITVDPDRHKPQRWPLLPLADWKAGKIPVCVVDQQGQVNIEGQTDPVIVHGDAPAETHPGTELIG